MIPLEVSEGKLMKIKFTDFELEPSCNGSCVFDYVMIMDGEDDDGDGIGDDEGDELLRKTCSDNIPLPFTSKSNKIKMFFKTDGSVEKKGWRMVYSEV